MEPKKEEEEMGFAGVVAGIAALEVTSYLTSKLQGKPHPEMDYDKARVLEKRIPRLQSWHVLTEESIAYLAFGHCLVTWDPRKGKGLTVDPHDGKMFRFKPSDDGSCSIHIHGDQGTDKWIFAGDQATVKRGHSEIKGSHEKFEVRFWRIRDDYERDRIHTFCTIQCKRDGEYWHVDVEGMIRHRKRTEDGFKIQVFYMATEEDFEEDDFETM